MTTRDRYMERVRPGTYAQVDSLADFIEAVTNGADLWHGGQTTYISWRTANSKGEYEALKALGWSAGSDYGSYGLDWMFVYNPHPAPTEDTEDT